MRMNLKRAVAGTAALAAASATLLIPTGPSVFASAAGTERAGSVTVNPTSGPIAGTTVTAIPPANTICPGDSASNSYRWHGFLVPVAVDPVTLTFNAAGPVAQPAVPGTYLPLFETGTQTPQVNRTTAANTGLITPIPAYDLSVAPIPDGEYWLGYACTVTGVIQDFGPTLGNGSPTPAGLIGKSATWATAVTIADGGTTYAVGARPAAPVATTVTPGDAELTVAFTHAASEPPTTSYEVTATPTGGGSPVTATGAASPITVPGLTNGTEYSVTVTATNDVGTSDPSNALLGTPSPDARPPVQNLVATPGPAASGIVNVSWAAPSGPAPTGYQLVVTPGGPTFNLGAGVLSQEVTGLAPGTPYTFTVTPTHDAPFVAAPASVVATPLADKTIVQVIDVTRPEGALVLTQRCGVYGELPAEAAQLGFADGFELEAAVGGPGTAPSLDVALTTPVDNFDEYPFPADPDYPTYCGVDLGTAQLVQTGAGAGEYYAASGRLNQVTVVDTRDTDLGWTITGTMNDFVIDGGGSTIDGNQLGWTTVVSSTTGGQVVSEGADVTPGTVPGLGDGSTLASANAGEGLGIAELDARLKLLIPVDVPFGDYTGLLDLTAI